MGRFPRPVVLAGAGLLALVLAFLGLAAAEGCGRGAASGPRPAGPLRVVVTVAPLAGLVRPLLPRGAGLATLVAPGQSEHGYELTAKDIATLDRADVVVYVGLGLEPRVEDFLRKHPDARRRVVVFADAAGISGAEHHDDAADHHDEPAGHDDHDDDGHHHGPIDPHLWLDPGLCEKLVPAVAAAVQDRLKAIGPSEAEISAVDGARAKLLSDIESLDAEIRAKLAPLGGQAIVTHHAAWGRFATRYGLKVAAVIRPIETSEPSKSAVDAAVKAIREQGARAIFVEPQFSDTVAVRIAKEAGAKLGHLDPLGDGDWFKLMRSNANALVETLGQ